MKKIQNPFDWYPRDHWYWPEHDTKLLQVIHQVHDLDKVLPLIPNKRVCIQAGGACGVWPVYLDQHFDSVISFEADYENYTCAVSNMGLTPMIHGALSSAYGDHYCVNLDLSEKGNSGAKYVCDAALSCSDDFVFTVKIDNFGGRDNVDFICLDIEGMEHQALFGAKETIERCSPVIMIEEKPLPHLAPGEHLKARQYLESIGYKEVLKINRDVVFKRD